MKAEASGKQGAGIRSYTWDFDGDGKTDATGARVTHAFLRLGLFKSKVPVPVQRRYTDYPFVAPREDVHHVVVVVTDDKGRIASTDWTLSMPSVKPRGTGAGSLSGAWWKGIDSPEKLKASERFPDKPDGRFAPKGFALPGIPKPDNFATYLRGYLHPSVSGTYRFYVASNNGSELWLSKDRDPAKARKVAQVSDWTGDEEWFKSLEQASDNIRLESGKTYYIHVIHGEGTNSQHISVAWKRVDANDAIEVIDGQYLSPFEGSK